jgi:hypothetical protein
MREFGMYFYPWTVDDIDLFTREYAALGCTAIAPALSYHHGNTLAARNLRSTMLRDAMVSFVPNAPLYGTLKPAVNASCAQSGVAYKIREWCKKNNILFSAWTVLLHNSTLGEAHPECCVENAFGDRLTHALCPSNPDVKEYAGALISDIARQFEPDSLMLESGTVQPALHGLHHEISNIAQPLYLRYLLSLCFCPHCVERASLLFPALDVSALRRRIQELALYTANHELIIPGNDDAVFLQMLFETPGLFEYQKARENGVTELTRVTAEILKTRRVLFTLIPSAVPFSINHLFVEGMNLTQNARYADTLLPLVYGAGERYENAAGIIRAYCAGINTGMAVSLHPAKTESEEALHSALARAASAGCDVCYLYNYSLASETRLAWVRRAVRLLNK